MVSYQSVNYRLPATFQSDFTVRPELYFLLVKPHYPPPAPRSSVANLSRPTARIFFRGIIREYFNSNNNNNLYFYSLLLKNKLQQ